ncbi:uncharacterized protein LOC141629053 [Silene latifolia]|uniref:uncharacterized protein LOC141629053 n=1 Tax=Silene latifolia TaxID=37657 RepID=UPI003D76AB2D
MAEEEIPVSKLIFPGVIDLYLMPDYELECEYVGSYLISRTVSRYKEIIKPDVQTFGIANFNYFYGLGINSKSWFHPERKVRKVNCLLSSKILIAAIEQILFAQRKYLMLSLLISGPKQPGNDIDVYLEPLIDDLKLLWDTGVDVYDAYHAETFNLRAMIYCTINDFPAYGNLSGYTVKGAKACPICEEDTIYDRLVHGGKNVHCIDVMHVEKNVCESLIGTLLNIPGKTKDGVKAREDMVAQKIRPELAPQTRDSRTYLPPACFTLSRKKKKSVCECLHGVKVPQGYSSNIKNLVSLKELKLVGLKSHDCHTLMQQLLPVALRGVLPSHVRDAITRLCYFFNAIYSKVVDSDTLNALQRDVIITMCQLEMFFPPSFFDIMQHLVVHLEHFYILQHMVDVHPYLEEHQTLLRAQNSSKGERWFAMEHNRSFLNWFSNEVAIQLKKECGQVSENVRRLAHGPIMHVLSYQGYDINGYSFYTKCQDDKSTMQNSGLALMSMPYIGVINEIWELDYVQFRIPVFRCMWVDRRDV